MTNFRSILPKSDTTTDRSGAAGTIQQSTTFTSNTSASSTISKIKTDKPELTNRNNKFSYTTMADPKNNAKLLHVCNTCRKDHPKKSMRSEKAMQLHIRSHIFQDNKKG